MNKKKHSITGAFWALNWFFFAFITAFFLIIAVLAFQGIFKGLFIKSYVPDQSQLQSLTINRQGTEYVFDRIAFYEYNLQSKEEKSYAVSLEQYGHILDILNNSSVLPFDQYLLLQFEEKKLAKLVIYLKSKNQVDSPSIYPYQTIEFIPNSGYFRIERPEREGPYVWDYYRTPNIYFEIKEALKK